MKPFNSADPTTWVSEEAPAAAAITKCPLPKCNRSLIHERETINYHIERCCPTLTPEDLHRLLVAKIKGGEEVASVEEVDVVGTNGNQEEDTDDMN